MHKTRENEHSLVPRKLQQTCRADKAMPGLLRQFQWATHGIFGWLRTASPPTAKRVRSVRILHLHSLECWPRRWREWNLAQCRMVRTSAPDTALQEKNVIALVVSCFEKSNSQKAISDFYFSFGCLFIKLEAAFCLSKALVAWTGRNEAAFYSSAVILSLVLVLDVVLLARPKRHCVSAHLMNKTWSCRRLRRV